MRTAPRRSRGVPAAGAAAALLTACGGSGAPDAAFSALLEQAYEAQAEALD
jgi:hypothetical protein